MSDHPFSQLSDIAPGNEASVSSDQDEENVLQLIKEVPSEEDRPRFSVATDSRKSIFLEDYDSINRNQKDNGLHEQLLDKKSDKKSKPSKRKIIFYSKAKQSDRQNKKSEVRSSKAKIDPNLSKDVIDKKEEPHLLDLGARASVQSEHKLRDSKILKSNAEEGEEDEEEVDDEEGYDETEKTNDFLRTKKLLRDVFPIFLFSVVQLVQEAIVLQFVGHYHGSAEFAAVALGNLWVNITGYVMIYGFTSSLATLSAHESGKGNSREIGIQLHQCIAITLILSVLAVFLNFYVTEILIFAGQPEHVAKIVPEYTWPLTMGLFPYSLISSIVNYLEAQQIYDPPSYSTVLSFIFHPLLCWLFIGVFKWGIFGGGLALCLVNTLDIIFLIGIVRFRPMYWNEVKDSIFLPSRDSLKGLATLLKVGFSALVLTCIEWWALEYTTVFAGWCGEEKLSAHTICIQLENLICMIASSFGLIIQTYAGNALGEVNKRDFLSICRLGPLLGFMVTGVFMFLMVVLRGLVPKLFTSAPNVISLASELVLFDVLYGMFDTSQILIGSILKGIGKYRIAIWASIIPYYFIGIPLSYVFAFNFASYNIKGIWVGIIIGMLMINVIYVFVLLRINIKAEIEKFQEELDANSAEVLSSNNNSMIYVDLVDVFLEKINKREANAAIMARSKNDFRKRKLGRL